MKIQELKVKTEKELSDIITQLKKETMHLRFQKATGELKNLSRFKIVRRTIARAKTLLVQMKNKVSK